jgi:hypothetical protein
MIVTQEKEKKVSFVSLTDKHLPSEKEESLRVIQSGGEIHKIQSRISQSKVINIGPLRVWKKNSTTPGLHVTRSFGDSMAKRIGVIAHPSQIIRCQKGKNMASL